MSEASSSSGPSVQALFPPLHVPPANPSIPETPHRVDESCISFCSQRSSQRAHGIEPMCSMICWRRRPVPVSKMKGKAVETSWSPFEVVNRWAAQRSIVVVKGTPNGVFGCYLEEMAEVDGKISGLKRGKDQEYYRKQWGDEGFTSGAQTNALHKFWEEVQRGGALKVADKGLKHWVKRSQDGEPPKDSSEGSERRGSGES